LKTQFYDIHMASAASDLLRLCADGSKAWLRPPAKRARGLKNAGARANDYLRAGSHIQKLLIGAAALCENFSSPPWQARWKALWGSFGVNSATTSNQTWATALQR
jgi:hypothetical protein